MSQEPKKHDGTDWVKGTVLFAVIVLAMVIYRYAICTNC